MDRKQRTGESSAQKETGLPPEQYKRYLFWTREVAKELVQYLANENRWEKYSWTQLELAKQREAAQDVNAHLQREKIPDVAIETIEKRLQKAIKDGQRSIKKSPPENVGAASTSTPNIEPAADSMIDPGRNV